MQCEIVAATGHRPDRLGGYDEENNALLRCLKIILREELETLYEQGARIFISGMAQGWDTHFAEAVLELKDKFPDIQLIAAVPFAGQGLRWPDAALRRWGHILRAADRIFVVDLGRYVTFGDLRLLVDQESPYPRWKVSSMLDDRNKWMVEQADLMLACWNGAKGGTGNCVKDAFKRGLSIRNIHPSSGMPWMLTADDLKEVA